MIDYVKCKISNPNVTALLKSSRLEFKGEYSISTGEILDNKLVVEFNYCKLEIYKSGSVYFSGSLHKLRNSLHNIFSPNYKKTKSHQGFNGNQFNLSQVIEAIEYICNILHCKPNQLILQNIEIGLNLPVTFCPQLFLTGLLYHNGNEFEHSQKRCLWVSYKNDYRIKLYNKSKQYGMLNYLLRYELHFDRMARIKQLGVLTLGDINKTTLKLMLELITKEFETIVYYDNTISTNNLTKPQLNAIKNYSNIRYWIGLKPKKRFNPKKKLNEIISNHSDNLKKIILQEIQKTGVTNTQKSKPKSGVTFTQELKHEKSQSKKEIRGTNTHSTIGVFIPYTSIRICPVTKCDISMQKCDSRLLSNTGLKYLEKTNKIKFNFLAKTLLTGQPNKYEKDIYYMLSKQIRNKYYGNIALYYSPQQRLFGF